MNPAYLLRAENICPAGVFIARQVCGKRDPGESKKSRQAIIV